MLGHDNAMRAIGHARERVREEETFQTVPEAESPLWNLFATPASMYDRIEATRVSESIFCELKKIFRQRHDDVILYHGTSMRNAVQILETAEDRGGYVHLAMRITKGEDGHPDGTFVSDRIELAERYAPTHQGLRIYFVFKTHCETPCVRKGKGANNRQFIYNPE